MPPGNTDFSPVPLSRTQKNLYLTSEFKVLIFYYFSVVDQGGAVERAVPG
jgi:hypothetical protein